MPTGSAAYQLADPNSAPDLTSRLLTIFLTVNVSHVVLTLEIFAELTRTLATQVLLSDMIVLWRGWVLWPRRRVVQSISVFLILGTFGA